MPLPTTPYDYAEPLTPTAVLTDFTLMVDLSRMTAGWWSAVNTTQARRGRAFKDDGVTELACDWIDFDSVARTGWLRVKFSGNMTNKNDNTIRIYPPNTSNSVQLSGSAHGSGNAYDADWVGYWPLMTNEDNRTTVATTQKGVGTLSYGGVTGKVGPATYFNGSSYINVGSIPDLGAVGEVTLMAWSQDDEAQTYTGIIDSSPGTGSAWALRENGTRMGFYVQNLTETGSAGALELSASTATTHFAGRLIDTGFPILWKNGSLEATGGDAAMVGSSTSATIGFQTAGGPHRKWTGVLEEIQLHQVSRSDAWVSHEYDQTDSQSAFWGTWNFSGEASATTTSRSRDRSRTR